MRYPESIRLYKSECLSKRESIRGGISLAELGNEKSVRIIFIRKDFQHTVANDCTGGKGTERKFGMICEEVFNDPAVFRRIDRAG